MVALGPLPAEGVVCQRDGSLVVFMYRDEHLSRLGIAVFECLKVLTRLPTFDSGVLLSFLRHAPKNDVLHLLYRYCLWLDFPTRLLVLT